MGKIAKGAVMLTAGAMIALPSGRLFLSEWMDGTKEVTSENLPKAVEITKTVGENAKNAAPSGLLEGQTTVPMVTVPNTIQGLSK